MGSMVPLERSKGTKLDHLAIFSGSTAIGALPAETADIAIFMFGPSPKSVIVR